MSDPEWGDNILAEFNYHLRQALSSSDEMDLYDVHSEDPVSLREWQELTEDYIRDAKKLIEVVTRNPDKLLSQLNSLMDIPLNVGKDKPK